MSSTKILDGKKLAKSVHKNIKNQVLNLKEKVGRVPGLAVILVGDNPASKAYVGTKDRVAKNKCGFETFDFNIPEDSTEEDIKKIILELNKNENVDGILLQLPLPKGLNSDALLDLINPEKDADGLHPLNQGLLQRGEGVLRPCTPMGCMHLIDLEKADLSGKNAVVIGRSILVGKPVSALLLERNATVTQAHSRTQNIEEIAKQADIIIAAVGVESLVKESWVKEGAIVIDVGINRNSEGKIVGDVDFDNVRDQCSAITPVPGGCGPMTVAILMYNTLLSYKKKFNLE
ncbi:UNVERIFIED_CONTAM: hypothetical protein GTU68_053381 [Idotea baltica]|nr:hypothetical protein [Idotea baltica]